jgi:hypothetical protein
VKAYLTAAGGSAVKSCTSTVAARACAMTGLTNGTPYHVTVAATTAAGAGPESGPRTAGTPRTVATAPLGVSATASAQKVKVSWKAPASTGGSAVTGYLATVYSAGTGGVVVAQCTANGTALTCTTPALTSGKTYYVSVVAVTAAGSSASSARAAVPVKSQPVKSQPRMV